MSRILPKNELIEPHFNECDSLKLNIAKLYPILNQVLEEYHWKCRIPFLCFSKFGGRIIIFRHIGLSFTSPYIVGPMYRLTENEAIALVRQFDIDFSDGLEKSFERLDENPQI